MKFGDQPGAGEDDAAATVFRDVVLLALAGFVAIVLLLLPHINPPGTAAESTDEPPGNVIVELFWDNDRDVDLDLWVAAPNDQAVGYSNRGAVYFNLLRDDLGTFGDKICKTVFDLLIIEGSKSTLPTIR